MIQEQDTELEAHSYITYLREEDNSFEKQVSVLEETYRLGKSK